MTETAEELSASTQCADSLPSDDVAMHRMCGWALKSMKDNLVIQAAKSKMAGCKDQLSLVNALKLSSTEKPKPVQYLDRGGSTFLKPQLWPCMDGSI